MTHPADTAAAVEPEALVAALLPLVRETQQELFPGDEDDDGPTAMCLPASIVLRDRLTAAGYDAHLIFGTFEVDFPDPETYDDEDDPAIYRPVHYWVQVAGTVLCDITAVQFADECDDAVDEVCVVDITTGSGRYEALSTDPDVDPPAEHVAWMSDYGTTFRSGPASGPTVPA